MDERKQMHISDRAGWLEYYARDLAAVVGASDPNEYTGWREQLRRAKADIEEIERRAERYEKGDK